MNQPNRPWRIIFAGTPDFAVPSLEALAIDPRFTIRLVLTQPDMPIGRSLTLTPPPIKQCALKYGLEVLQPQRLKHIHDRLREEAPDVIVVVAYAHIIKPEVLTLPPFGCVNVHGSLLPDYRGAAVVQAPIRNGDEETGVTVMLMDEGIDTGPLLYSTRYAIKHNETADSLSVALAELGGRVLPDVLAKYLDKEIMPQPQPADAPSRYIGRLTKADGLLDWNQPTATVERFVRAMTSWPSAWTWASGKQLKVLEVDQNGIALAPHKPGKTFLYNSNLAVQCGDGSLLIRRLQLEGKRAMTSQEFVRGYQDFVGTVLD